MKAYKNQWLLTMPSPSAIPWEPQTRAHTMVSGVQTPSQCPAMGQSPKDVGLQTLENTVLSRGIIRKSACVLTEITIRKSQEDMKLKTGDQLKMFVELRKPCFVYVIHDGARGEIQRLFPYDIQQFTTDYQTAKIYEIPPNDGWFRINEQAGLETFYLVASAQRLTDLEQLLATYAAAQPAEQPLAATHILTELRNLLKQHRASMKPGRPVPIAGNMRKGIEGVEITAPQFYIETFTIEHS